MCRRYRFFFYSHNNIITTATIDSLKTTKFSVSLIGPTFCKNIFDKKIRKSILICLSKGELKLLHNEVKPSLVVRLIIC